MFRKILVFSLITMVLSVEAAACGMVQAADPKVGSLVTTDIKRVSLQFSEKVYPEKSTIDVLDMAGNKVNKGLVFGDKKDDSRISTYVTNLVPGKYKVSWNVFCECGSLMPGSYKFIVQ
jgi:methionine-rich copper-binding protein CopC